VKQLGRSMKFMLRHCPNLVPARQRTPVKPIFWRERAEKQRTSRRVEADLGEDGKSKPKEEIWWNFQYGAQMGKGKIREC